jgi:5-oxoprolinase (ATP-hydrolysing) subunit B
MSEFGTPNFRRVGAAAIVLECNELGVATQRRLWGLGRAVRHWQHVREAVVGAGNLTLAFEPEAIAFETLRDKLTRAWDDAPRSTVHAHTIEIPVRYDGDDLQAVAQACSLRIEEVVEFHAAGDYVVAFIGFLPGFAYLDGLDARLHVARRTQPRTRVPGGSVAIAGGQSGVYPFDSPGGWHVIGRTELRMFDSGRDPAALLQPGDAVRFVAL